MLKAAIVPVTSLQQNCTILFDDVSKQAVVIDPGGQVDAIAKAVHDLDVTVEAIWLTHGHLDHAGGAEEAKRKFQVEIIGPHKDDDVLLMNIEKTAKSYGLPDAMANASPDQWLEEGDVLSVAEHRFEVFHCPGHAPGHVIFVNREQPITIMGDVLFNGSVGRTDLPFGDHGLLMQSIKDKVLPLGDDMAFLCGHGPMSTIGAERETNPYLEQLR